MKEGMLIRTLIVALPAGLLFLGGFSMYQSNFNPDKVVVDPNEAIRLEASALHRRPVNRADLETSIEILSGRIGERHLGQPGRLESAAAWIQSTLGEANMGYRVERQIFEVGGVPVRNLIAELPGRDRRDEIIIVGAHYDTLQGNVGANDNGTGMAALIALARSFAGDQQDRTIRFVSFVNGAIPYFQTEEMGSLVYAKLCRSKGERIVAMLSLDSLSLADVNNPVIFLGNLDARFFVDSAATAFTSSTSVNADARVLPPEALEKARSDNWAFWQQGYPAVAVTGDADLVGDAISLENFESVTQGLKRVIDTWANP